MKIINQIKTIYTKIKRAHFISALESWTSKLLEKKEPTNEVNPLFDDWDSESIIPKKKWNFDYKNVPRRLQTRCYRCGAEGGKRKYSACEYCGYSFCENHKFPNHNCRKNIGTGGVGLRYRSDGTIETFS